MQLSTSRYYHSDPEAEKQAETGWDRVSAGLNRILLGNLLIVGCAVVFAMLLTYVIAALPKITSSNKATLEEAIFLIGSALLGIATIYGYVTIISGKWRCVMSAPERCGAKWLIFASITCLVIGPGMSIATDLAGGVGAAFDTSASKARYLKMQETMMMDGELTEKELWALATPAIVMSIAGFLVSVTGEACFLLFLRAIGQCFEDTFQIRLVEGYLTYLTILLVGSVAAPFGLLVIPGVGAAVLMVALLIGWAVAFLLFLLILMATSTCILRNAPQHKAALTR